MVDKTLDDIISIQRRRCSVVDISLFCDTVGIVRVRPKFPDYSSRASRLNSYAGWSEHHPIRPDALADAGFFYKGYGDSVQCHYCGVGVRLWDKEDDVWIEHAVWSPKCGYVLLEKGNDFVAAVVALSDVDMKGIKYEHVTKRLNESHTPSPLKAVEDFLKLNEQQQLNLKCRICLENPPGVIFLPCSHYISCQACSGSLSTCPQCDTSIERTIEAYLTPK